MPTENVNLESPENSNWVWWVMGGGVVLVIALGLIFYNRLFKKTNK